MRYSTYVLLQAVIGGLVFLVFAALFLAIGGSAATGLVALLAVFIVIGFGLSVAWAYRAMESFDGSPFPGLLGILGVEIIPDAEYDSRPDEERKERFWFPGSRTRLIPATHATPIFPRHGCAKCGAVMEGSDSRYCRLCGASFDS